MNRFRMIAGLAVITLVFLSARATLCVPAAAAPPGHPPGAKRGRTVEEAAGRDTVLEAAKRYLLDVAL